MFFLSFFCFRERSLTLSFFKKLLFFCVKTSSKAFVIGVLYDSASRSQQIPSARDLKKIKNS